MYKTHWDFTENIILIFMEIILLFIPASVDQREASVSTSVSSEEQLQISTEVPEP